MRRCFSTDTFVTQSFAVRNIIHMIVHTIVVDRTHLHVRVNAETRFYDQHRLYRHVYAQL